MSKIENVIKFMEQIAADDSHGYAQDNRNGSPDYDCSSFIGTALSKAGFKVNPDSTTRNLYTQLIACGFKEIGINDPRQRGDIFLTPGKHVVACTDSNNVVHASINENNGVKNGKPGDQTGREICVRSFYNPTYKWTYHLRYTEAVPTSYITKGIDVSAFNIISDYQAVKNDGVQFAILKIVRKDLNLDKLFETHLNGFNKVGIPVIAVYNYSYATTVTKAKSDAATVTKYLKQYNMPTSTTVYMDVEDKCQQGLGALLIGMINAYQTVIENAGYKFGLYTGLSFWNSNIKPYESKLKCNTEWIARYKKGYAVMPFSENPSEDSKPNIGREIEGYQYTSSGQVSGIQGNVDINVIYGDVNSSSSVIPSIPPSNLNTIVETSIEMIGKINTQSSNLNIRKEPNSSSTKLGAYKKGTTVQLISKTSNGWYRTNDGYIFSDYVINAIGKVFNCVLLNLRKTPVVENDNKIKTLPVNTELYLLKEVDGWYKVKTKDNVVGYVSKKYIQIL